MRSDAIKPGDVIAGKYRVRAIMSRSRGFLVEAFHTEFDQRVVIRILSPALVDDKEVERFRRESRTLAKLESEHVARILDVGKTQDGAFYFVRQYLEGMDLAAHLKQRGQLPLAEAVLYLLQASEAVAETHTHNIILRELQPSHLFLTSRIGGAPQVKIIDFGTAKLMRDAAAPTAGGELTATAMFGLSCYSSPELVRKAQHVDIRTDVWSLGAILYQLLTGRAPFAGEMAALMLAITRDEPIPVTQYRRDVPPDIDKIIHWALAKDPDGRFANVHAFAHALSPFTSAEGQLLVQRIGQITAAGKRKRQDQAAAMDRDHPVSIDGNDLIEEVEDAPTQARSPEYAAIALQQAGAKPQAGSFESTVFIGADFQPQSPSAGPGPAARGSQPMFGGGAAEPPRGSQPGRAPVWQPSPPGALGPTPSAPGLNGDARISGAPREPLPTVTPSSGGFSSPKPQPKGQKLALVAVAGAVVLLSAVAVFVVVKGRPGTDAGTTPDSASSAAASAGAPASAAPPVSASGTPSAEPAAASAEPAAASAEPAVASAEPTAQPAHTGKLASNAPGPSKSPGTKTASAPPPPPPPPPPPAGGGGDNGTIVAVAVGGSCAFSVNGSAKGTMSTLKVSVKPGTYSVTCAPSSGASKSKSVTVSSGGTAMAMFKL
jgi:serine/threonine-protein kinase